MLVVVLTSCQSRHNGHGSGNASSSAAPGTQEDLEENIGNFVLFELNQSTLSSDATAVLNRQVDWLNNYQYINVLVEGHCDIRGTREYNLALGERRANAVKDYLVSRGINSSRISVISYGKERPVVLGSGPEVWAQNRRAVVVIN